MARPSTASRLVLLHLLLATPASGYTTPWQDNTTKAPWAELGNMTAASFPYLPSFNFHMDKPTLYGEPCMFDTDCVAHAFCVRRDSGLRYTPPSSYEMGLLDEEDLKVLAVRNHCRCRRGFEGELCHRNVVAGKTALVATLGTIIMCTNTYMRIMAFKVQRDVEAHSDNKVSAKGFFYQKGTAIADFFAGNFAMTTWQPWSEERVWLDTTYYACLLGSMMSVVSAQALDIACTIVIFSFFVFLLRLPKFIDGPRYNGRKCAFEESVSAYQIVAECPDTESFVEQDVQVSKEFEDGSEQPVFNIRYDCGDVPYEVSLKRSTSIRIGESYFNRLQKQKDGEVGSGGIAGAFRGIYDLLFSVPHAVAYENVNGTMKSEVVFKSCHEFVSNAGIIRKGHMLANAGHQAPILVDKMGGQSQAAKMLQRKRKTIAQKKADAESRALRTPG